MLNLVQQLIKLVHLQSKRYNGEVFDHAGSQGKDTSTPKQITEHYLAVDIRVATMMHLAKRRVFISN